MNKTNKHFTYYNDINKIVNQLKEMKVNSDAMQYIIEELGMNDQMLRQLILSNPQSDTKDLYDEHIRLSNKELKNQKTNKSTIMNKKILHLHLGDSLGNIKTLVCNFKDGSIRYTLYGGTGSSGTPFSLSNIQFYDIVNGRIKWVNNRSLPIENLPNESIEEFRVRVINMLNLSTNKVIKVVNNEVKFA